MANNGTSLTHKMERKAVEILVDKILKEMDKDRNKEVLKLVDMAEKFYGKDYKKEDIIDILDVLDLPKVEVNEFLKNKIINGQILENRYDSSKVMFTYNNELLAIYQVYNKDKLKIKPYKMFGGIKWF